MDEFKEENDGEVCVDCVNNFYNEVLSTLQNLRNWHILDEESYERAKMNLEKLVFGVEY